MKIKKKDLCAAGWTTIVALTSAELQTLSEILSHPVFKHEGRPKLTFKVRIMKDNRALHEESLVYTSLYYDCYKMAECRGWAAVVLY